MNRQTDSDLLTVLVVVGAAEGGGGQGAAGHVELVVQTLVVRGLGARHYEGDQVQPGEDSEDTVEAGHCSNYCYGPRGRCLV